MQKPLEEQKNRISSKIAEELDVFSNDIKVIEGWDFNQRDTIEQAVLYYNSKFVDGDTDDDGLKLYFFNIIKATCGTTTKAIDVDTKDIIVQNAAGGDWLKAWFYQRDLKYWLKKQQFGKVLNRISRELPIYGTVVLKYVKGKVEFVNLKNFICETNADTLDQSNYIIEEHYYTPNEFKKIGKEKKLDNVNEVLEMFRNSKEQYIRVFERYGELENVETGEWEYRMVLVADIPTDIKQSSRYETTYAGSDYVLANVLINSHPYKEIHVNKIAGRWLGVGIPELLSENQIRINEIMNQRVKSSYWSTLRLFQTKDTGVARNLLQDCENGDVLNPEDLITAVPMEDRNGVGYYDSEMNQWTGNAKEQTFSTDIMMGQRPPSGATLGAAQLSAAQSMSFFDQMKEDYCLEVKDLIVTRVIAGFEKTNNLEHMVKIAGEDIEKLTDLIVNQKVNNAIINYVKRKKRLPDQKFIELTRIAETELLSKSPELQVKIPDGFYKDVEYDIDVIITDESEATAAKAASLVTALQTITTDPTILTDPTKKRIFAKSLEQVGINLFDLEAEVPKSSFEPQTAPVVTGVGGGVSATPNMGGTIGQKRI